MKELKDYFVTKEQAESLKELGFEEKCLASYAKNGELLFITSFHHIEINAPLIAQAKELQTKTLFGDCFTSLTAAANCGGFVKISNVSPASAIL